MGHRQNSFSILACLQYKGGGILVTKNNLGDWRSPYSSVPYNLFFQEKKVIGKSMTSGFKIFLMFYTIL